MGRVKKEWQLLLIILCTFLSTPPPGKDNMMNCALVLEISLPLLTSRSADQWDTLPLPIVPNELDSSPCGGENVVTASGLLENTLIARSQSQNPPAMAES